ncbi:MAG: hypothetical protein M3O61_03660 [Gemmatimonadota bacterium]|nr:hypothetical protein [Gemmatimonadota bacterium]
MTREAERLDSLHVEVRHHIRQVERHRNAIHTNPEKSPIVRTTIVACAFLFFTGIIYPLSFLPVSLGRNPTIGGIGALFEILFSLRGALLTAVSIVFSALLYALHVANKALTHRADDLSRLDAITKFAYYSEYLEIAEQNKRTTAATRSFSGIK